MAVTLEALREDIGDFLARRRTFRPDPVELGTAVGLAPNMLYWSAANRRGVEVVIDMPEQVVAIESDPGRIWSVPVDDPRLLERLGRRLHEAGL